MTAQALCPCDTEMYLEKFHRILKTMICEMTSAQLKDSISYNFIVQMVPHHEAAIQMSENILCYTKDTRIKQISENIITMQKKGIQDMQNIKKHCLGYRNYRNDLCQYQNALQPVFDKMFMGMRNAYSDQYVNCNFLREMIPHHEGAVKMSKVTLKYHICPQLTPILQEIIREQEQGIKEMEALLCECPDKD